MRIIETKYTSPKAKVGDVLIVSGQFTHYLLITKFGDQCLGVELGTGKVIVASDGIPNVILKLQQKGYAVRIRKSEDVAVTL
jgi:repressor of nif and glnA expression